MIELALVATVAMLLGVVTGLFPALPVYVGTMLLYGFSPDLPLEQLLIFWLVTAVGSQFFGSVAAILTQIPGEDSSLIYLKDVATFSVREKATLLYETAFGSLVASLCAIAALTLAVATMPESWMLFFATIKFQLLFYLLALLSFCFLNRSVLVTLGLVATGIFLAPKNNYALPDFWIQSQSLVGGTTFFMLVFGLTLLPEILAAPRIAQGETIEAIRRKSGQTWLYLKSTLLGMVAGLIPGPSAFLGSALSYRTTRDRYSKVVAAETSNNAAVIMSALPLLLVGLPINQNTMLFANLMEVKGIDLAAGIAAAMPTVATVFALCAVIYFFLSTRIIRFYVAAVSRYSGWVLAVTVGVTLAMAVMDFGFANMSGLTYTGILSVLCVVGVWLKRMGVSSLPLLFAYVLGDKIVWLVVQTYLSHS